jgi:hypothetical protein
MLGGVEVKARQAKAMLGYCFVGDVVEALDGVAITADRLAMVVEHIHPLKPRPSIPNWHPQS